MQDARHEFGRTKPSHARALQIFSLRLALLLMFREALRWAAAWFFLWGVVILAARIAGVPNQPWMPLGLLGALAPMLIVAALMRRKLPQPAGLRAAYDNLNQCGGLLMAEEAADMSAWQVALPEAAVPHLRWRGGRAFGLLALAVLFVVATLLLPDRWTSLTTQRPLEIGKLISELQAEVHTLHEEKILEQPKADELQKQLSQLEKKSSALDPNKTWEALDHLKESNSDLAKQAAEEALNKMASLSQAETIAGALEKASEAGMGKDTATQAARDLAGMMKAAKLEDGLLKTQIPPELLSALNGLSKEDMEKLLSSIQSSKSGLGKTLTNLAKLKLIDPKALGQCKNAGECKNGDALAAFLSTCTNGGACSAAICAYGRGGLTRGDQPGDSPMTWSDVDESGAKFKETALPASSQTSDSQLVGISKAAPDLSAENILAEHGVLTAANSSGGAANSQVILPRHKQAVQKYFKRDEKK